MYKNMKEYIKLFNNLQSADGYIIADIPFTTTVKRDAESLAPQNVRCNVEDKMITVEGDTIIVVDKPTPTILHLNNGTDVELTGTTITSEMTSSYKSTLVGVEVSDSVASIGNNAFQGCTSLSAITIPDSVISIGNNVFSGCTSLSAITIPDSVTNIGTYAFYNCSGLTEMTCAATTPPTINSSAFSNVPTNIPVYVPSGSISAYQSAQYWGTFSNFQAIS